MEFIDHTGHIFSLDSYINMPIGYEYNETPYIFWFDTEYGDTLSIDNYYFKPIRMLIPVNDTFSIDNLTCEISIDNSKVFNLLSSNKIQDLVVGNKTINDNIFIDTDIFSSVLTKDDIHIVDNITETLYKVYDSHTYEYTSNGVQMKYDGPVTKKDDDKYYGVIKFGPLTKEVELTQVSHTFKYTGNLNDGDTIIVNGEECTIRTFTQTFIMLPFYVVCCSSEPATWETNILIKISTDGKNTAYTPITVGANIVDSCEALIINGENLGVSLPKDILKAVYQCGFYSDMPNEELYKVKLKEYLMNFMSIKGEQGNIHSAITSLKWFGWGDRVTINKLWKTDIAIKNHYIRDNFDILTDMSDAYELFRNATLLSLSIQGNTEMHETYHDFTKEFYGEAKPEFENLFDKTIVVHYDEGDIDFIRGYFDYTFDELALKVCALRYFYDKYFLPLHMKVLTASIEFQHHINDIKWIVKPSVIETAQPVFTNLSCYDDNDVVFPSSGTVLLTEQTHWVDDNYNEFANIESTDSYQDIWYINDTCASIPIKFMGEDKHYMCVMVLKKDDIVVHKSTFDFVQHGNDNYMNFVIHPKTLNTIITGQQSNKYDVNYWLDSKYELDLYVNGMWYIYKFNLVLPELNIDLGRLEYKYSEKDSISNFRQIASISDKRISFNAFMWNPELVTVNNMDFIEEVSQYMEESNTSIICEDSIPMGSLYFYIEGADGTRYVVSTSTNKYLEIDEDGNIMLGNSDLTVSVNQDGTYNINGDDGLIMKSSMNDSIESYIRKYYTKSNVFVDGKYLNRCHLVDIFDKYGNLLEYHDGDDAAPISITINGEQCGFGDNSSAATISLYRDFFTDDGECKFERKQGKVTLNKINNMIYDFYLMHDTKHWYGMFISRTTIDTVTSGDLSFNIKKGIYDLDGNTIPEGDIMDNRFDMKVITNGNTYYMKHVASDSKILVNRLKYVSADGINHFNCTDIIAMAITNNHRLCYKIGLGTKWDIVPMSLGMGDSSHVESPNEMAIVSIGNGNVKYTRGYYDVVCRYSLDDYIQHEYVKHAKFRVDI